jgi:hypothetical protein
MASANELLTDSFERVRESVHRVLEGLDEQDLAFRPDDEANTIGWLVWHLTRVQDDHVADVAGRDQVWTAHGWAGRFALPFDETATGFGHTAADVALVRVSADLLAGYYDATHEQTLDYVGGLADADLDRVVDERWDPPVTLAVRLVSVFNDDAQHIGQAAYLRGILDRRA